MSDLAYPTLVWAHLLLFVLCISAAATPIRWTSESLF